MKKRIGLLLGVLLLTGCAEEQTAMEPAAELVATAPSLGTDLEWRVTVPAGEAMEPEEAVVAEAVIEPAHWSTLGFKIGGKVVEVLVEEGDVVDAGDLLIRLDPTDAQLSVREIVNKVHAICTGHSLIAISLLNSLFQVLDRVQIKLTFRI